MTAEVAPPLDVAGLAAFCDRALDGRRRAGLQDLEDHARRRRADVRNLAQGAVGLQQRFDRLFEREDAAAARL